MMQGFGESTELDKRLTDPQADVDTSRKSGVPLQLADTELQYPTNAWNKPNLPLLVLAALCC